MYVYISEICQQETKLYQIEQKIEELANWVKAGSRQDFFKLFEIFQHPYYVRKGVGYRYRLLAKMLDVPFEGKNYQIVVFFRIFLRGDDDYKTLFHQADEHGDFFYNQQNLDNKIADYVACLANPTHKLTAQLTSERINQSDSLAYLIQAKTNLLQLSQRQHSREYYQEGLSWYSGTRPFLTQAQLHQTYQHVQHGLDSIEPQIFEIDDNSLQFQLSPLRLSRTNDNTADVFTRYLPTDTVWDNKNWLSQQQNTLPLYLNAFGQTVYDMIFGQNDSFPLLVNAPALHGKTSLLAILTAHYLLQSPSVNQGLLPVLLICQPYEKLALRTAIANYLLYQVNNNVNIQLHSDSLAQTIDACCMDLYELAEGLLPDFQTRFDKDLLIDRYRFGKLWDKAPFIKNQKLSHISTDLAWFVIQHLIKGEQGIFGEGKAFKDGLTNYSALTIELYQLIYDEIWLGWYESLQEQGYWDLHDLLALVNRQGDFSQRYASILIDNTEQYSNLAVQVILRCNEWWERPEVFCQAPLIFIGNTHATIPHQIYHWQNELNTLLYRLYRSQSDDDLLQTQRIDYDIADFVTTSNYAVQSQRSKTNLIAFANCLNHDTLLLDTQLLFVDINDTALTQALLLNHKIALVANSHDRDAKKALKKPKTLGNWFQYADVSQIERECYNLAYLPSKQYSLALVGFTHSDFAYFKQDSKEFAFLAFEKRYQLNSILNSLRIAMQQGLKQVFIIASADELPLWQSLFCPILGANAIQTATLNDINPHYQQQTEQFIQQKQQALEGGNIEAIFDIAIQHYQRFEYAQYFEVLLHICGLTQDYQDYFDNLMNDEQKQLTFEYLWQHQKAQVILDYQQHFTKSVRYNIMSLQMMYNQPLDVPFEQGFINVTNHYVKQCQKDIDASYWHIVFAKILQKLDDDTLTANWSAITKQLDRLKKAGIDIPKTVLATSYYRQGDSKTAIELWQHIESSDATVRLPNFYYEHCLKQTTDWQQQLLIVIKLKKLGVFMNILTNHDLNELQASYWDKILPFLAEEEELETTLLALLPQIHDLDILEKIYQYCQFDTSENFVIRLQRLKTLQACLQGDWDTVIERLEHYVPVHDTEDMMSKLSQVFTTKKVMRGPNHMQKTVLRDKLPKPSDEIIDILYALNLNPAFYMPITVADFESYCQQLAIQTIFDLIRQNLSIPSDDDFNGVLWSIDFPAVRSLAYLLEKSDNPKDALTFYTNITSFSKNKKLIMFAMERLYFLLNRAKQLIADGLDISHFTTSDNEEKTTDALTALINKLEKHYDKLLKNIQLDDDAANLPTLKTAEELVKSILALTDKEHREIQRIAQEQRQALKEQEAEAKRIAEEEQQQAEQRARIEHVLRLKEIEEEQRLQTEQLEQQRLEDERLENERLENEKLEQQQLKQETQAQPVHEVDEEIDKVLNDEIATSNDESSIVDQLVIEGLALLDQMNANDTGYKMPFTEEFGLTDDTNPADLDLNNNRKEELSTQQTKPIASHWARVTKAVRNSPNLSECNALTKPAITKATSELQFFNWRVFVNRMLQRINIEDINTGERCSITLDEGVFSSDWQYSQMDDDFVFIAIPLAVTVNERNIVLYHFEDGIELKIDF